VHLAYVPREIGASREVGPHRREKMAGTQYAILCMSRDDQGAAGARNKS
jgi:hypothetical protein